MPHWVIVVDHDRGEGESLAPVARFDGTREEARRRLYETACTHRFSTSLRERRREVFRQDDDAYYVEIRGALGTYRLRYCLAERVWSSEEPPPVPRSTSAGLPDPGEPAPRYWSAPDQ
ncbi:hypothetical protein [Streptomyces sp. NPDC052225]|uniref:hypothetical protein n=1 Tax=Streptomyces sp. NPDC052225 TaxID=3154949 RepID=UPI00343F3AD5